MSTVGDAPVRLSAPAQGCANGGERIRCPRTVARGAEHRRCVVHLRVRCVRVLHGSGGWKVNKNTPLLLLAGPSLVDING